MDGYHLYRKELNSEQTKRRGAPDTFNKAKFKEDLIKCIKNEFEYCFPSFDHSVQDPIEGDIIVSKG